MRAFFPRPFPLSSPFLFVPVALECCFKEVVICSSVHVRSSTKGRISRFGSGGVRDGSQEAESKRRKKPFVVLLDRASQSS